MRRVELFSEPEAEAFEGLAARRGPTAAGARDEQLERQGIVEHLPETSRLRLKNERARIGFRQPIGQILANTGSPQWVELKRGDPTIGRHRRERMPVNRSEPVGCAAGDAESWTTELFQPRGDFVERFGCFATAGPCLVEAVDEEHLVSPLGMGRDVGFCEPACPDHLGVITRCRALLLELGRLTGTWLAEEHARRNLAKRAQWLSSRQFDAR